MDALFGEDAVSVSPRGLPPAQERKRLRRACRLSLHHVASACSVSESTVHTWEQNSSTPRGRNAAVYHQLLQGLEAYLTKTPLSRASVPLPDWAALGSLRHHIPFQDEAEATCWRCRQPTSQRVGGTPQHLGTRCPRPRASAEPPAPAATASPHQERQPASSGCATAPWVPPVRRLDYPSRGRRTTAGPLAVLQADPGAGLVAHLTTGTTLPCPAHNTAQLLSWAVTAGLGTPAVHPTGLKTGPLLVLTDTATAHLNLPLTPPTPAQRHPRSDYPLLLQLHDIGWQSDAQGLDAWCTVHPRDGDPAADAIHLAITDWGALHRDDWQLPAGLTAPQLAAFLGQYQRLLRTPTGTPAACGHRLMSDLRPAPHHHATTRALLCPGRAGALTRSVAPAPCEAPEGHRLARGRPAADSLAIGDIDWWRPPTDAETASPHVLCLAVNLLHVADSNNIPVADGPARPADHPAFHRKTPGSWLVDLSGVPGHPHLPAPFPADGPAWHPTEAVAYAQQCGIPIQPMKGYLRTGTCRPYLTFWYQHIRQAHFAALARLGITKEMPPDAYCHAVEHLTGNDSTDLALLRAVHASALGGIDMLANQPRDPDHIPGQPFDTPRSPTWRPDLRASILANARANLHRKLAMTARTGRFPLAVYQDRIIYASHSPSLTDLTDDPESAFRLGLSPGQVRPVATRSMAWYLQQCGQQANPAHALKETSAW